MESCPGCWAAYGEVLAREYGDVHYARNHRLTVDAYAVQHPGHPSPQSIQSVALHLISLCLVLERRFPMEKATEALAGATKLEGLLFWLTPPPSRGTLTVADVQRAAGAPAHLDLVSQWASCAWTAWAPHHAQVRTWLKAMSL